MSGSLNVGLNTSVSGWSDQASRMNQIESQTSTPWMREAFNWSQIEPSNGTYNFSRYDTLMTLAAQKNVHILANLLDTPSWAGSSDNAIPNDPSAFAAFVATVVGRYGPHGSFWSTHPTLTKMPITTFELWNEPYYNNGNNGDYNPGRYARLVKAAGAAGHAADPSAKFLLAADNQCALVSGTWVWWIDALYQAVPDLSNYFDGIAVHPYGSDLTNVQYPTPGQAYNGYSQVRRLETIRQQFVNHGASDKPLWITEIGWPTCTNGGSDRCTTASRPGHRHPNRLQLRTVHLEALRPGHLPLRLPGQQRQHRRPRERLRTRRLQREPEAGAGRVQDTVDDQLRAHPAEEQSPRPDLLTCGSSDLPPARR